MTRRQLMVGLALACVSRAMAKAFDPRSNDLRLEERISQTQQLCLEAGTAYQQWLSGRVGSPAAATTIRQKLLGLEAFQGQAASLAVPQAQTAIRHWSRLQKQEMAFFLRDIQDKRSPSSQAELQKRWQNAVAIQADLLQTRHQQLLAVLKCNNTPRQVAYYNWKSQLLSLQTIELDLARQVAQAFQKQNNLSGVTQKALALAQQAEAIKVPAICSQAHALYIQRFNVLGRLCQVAESSIKSLDQDSVEDLRDTEEIYRKKSLASDDASRTVLRTLLLKTH